MWVCSDVLFNNSFIYSFENIKHNICIFKSTDLDISRHRKLLKKNAEEKLRVSIYFAVNRMNVCRDNAAQLACSYSVSQWREIFELDTILYTLAAAVNPATTANTECMENTTHCWICIRYLKISKSKIRKARRLYEHNNSKQSSIFTISSAVLGSNLDYLVLSDSI